MVGFKKITCEISATTVSHSNQLLRLNVGFIVHQAVGFSREFSFKEDVAQIPPDTDLHDFKGKVRITRTTEGLLLQGDFQASVEASCTRCLKSFKQIISTAFSELYTFPSHAEKDTELLMPDNGIIDIAPLLREYLLLEVPINTICSENCKGLCPVCGEDLNQATCECDQEAVDPRLAVLKELLDENN